MRIAGNSIKHFDKRVLSDSLYSPKSISIACLQQVTMRIKKVIVEPAAPVEIQPPWFDLKKHQQFLLKNHVKLIYIIH